MKRLAVLIALTALCSLASTADAGCRRGGFLFRGRGGCGWSGGSRVVYYRPTYFHGGGCVQPQFVQPQTVPFVQPPMHPKDSFVQPVTTPPGTTTVRPTVKPGVPYYVPPR